MTLTPEEEKVLRNLLNKKKRSKPRKVARKHNIPNDAIANMFLLLIVVILLIGLVTR